MADISGYLKIISGASSGEAVRDAIVNCMRAINSDAAIKVTSLLITKADNVTYKAGVGQAYKNVTVNISGSGESDPEKTYKFASCTVTEGTGNGTITPTDLGYDENTYFDKVEVAIDWESIMHPANLGEEATMSYTLTDSNSGKKYWDASAAGYDYVKRIWVDTNVGNLPDYPGGSTSGGVKRYTVNYYTSKDLTDCFYKVDCDEGRSPDEPSKNTPRYPTGTGNLVWMPQCAVTSDPKTQIRYPSFEDPTISDEDIYDSWKDIINNEHGSGGRYYPLGSRKYVSWSASIPFTHDKAVFDYDWATHIPSTGSYTFNCDILFIKVAIGESSSSSTWLGIPSNTVFYPSHIRSTYTDSPNDAICWEKDYVDVHRDWLNKTFYNYVIPSTSDCPLRQNIRSKRLHFGVKNTGDGMIRTASSLIWLPCAKEMYIEGMPCSSNFNLDRYVNNNTLAQPYMQNIGYTVEKMKSLCETLGRTGGAGQAAYGRMLDRLKDTGGYKYGDQELLYCYNTNYRISESGDSTMFAGVLIGFCI
jgi:hypothetical protein